MKNLLFVIIIICLVFTACEKSTKQLEQVAQPTFSPNGGVCYTAQSVSIICATNNAEIRYTLDNTNPTQSSTLYNAAAPIGIADNKTIKAQAFKANMKASNIASASYSFGVGNLTIYPAGGTFGEPKIVTIYSETAGTIVRYTLDGSEPDSNSTIYTPPLTIDKYTVLKAKGYVAGWTPSQTFSATFSFNAQPPIFDITEGLHYNTLDVALSSPTNGATIRYTTNGVDPTETSTIYTTPIPVPTSTTIKAKTYKTLWNSSTIASASYELKVPVPTLSPLPNTFSGPQNVTIASSIPNVNIYYTINGSEPMTTDNLYTSPFTITSLANLQVKAYKTGWTPSNIVSGTYSFVVSEPVISPPGGTFIIGQTVSMTCSTPQSEIRYTTDDSEPTNSSTLYSAPFLVPATATIQAKAFRAGWNSSSTASETYEINVTQTCETPTFGLQAGTYNSIQLVSIFCATPGATIKYTTNNSEPTTGSTTYSTPVTIGVSTTIKAKAFRTNWLSSQTASVSYTINFNSDQMLDIPGGTFTMGRTTGEGDADELPPHTVTLSPFSIGKYEVMQGDWLAVMSGNPSYFTNNLYRPVERVSWYGALVYCNKRSILEGLNPAYTISGETNPNAWGAIPLTVNPDWDAVVCDFSANGYRLPTEAEWEYVARGTTNNPYYIYSGSNDIAQVAWYQANSAISTHPIGLLQGNGFTYDMSGNVSEWCWDMYDSAYYASSPANNPTGPTLSSFRVFRGGSWDNFLAIYCRVISRDSIGPATTQNNIGLRVVRSIP